ncbi:hypothetical protein GCM10022408_00920 [Hymenobacter fastidiosus]|uniref:HTH cro/C1-type domain-containing protein n=1 Tax=Hymenobacter fastidiosus TaxID=486264 RepID=A0ABP7R984_9BACT
MVERIRDILKARQLTPTQFADAIGLARPIVSHILSGRNKPSLEVIQKIIAAFPDLSLPWLLSGSGAMTATAPVMAALPAPTSPAEPLRAPESRAAPKQVRPLLPEPAPEADILPQAPAVPERVQVPAVPVPAPVPPAEPTAPVTAAGSAPPDSRALSLAVSLGEPGKRIRRIVIFYHDGTFADYQPE